MSKQAGFTLIEILIVVVIVSILSVLGVQMISSGSVERNLQQHGRILQASIEYSCDQATLQNIPYGIKFSEDAYSFVQYINKEWLEFISSDTVFAKKFEDGSLLSLIIDDQTVVLNEDFNEIPQVLCNSSGELTTFALVISDATDKHHYQIKSKEFWQIEGQWLDAKKN